MDGDGEMFLSVAHMIHSGQCVLTVLALGVGECGFCVSNYCVCTTCRSR